MNSSFLPKLIGIAIVIFLVSLFGSASSYVIEPGMRGIKVTLGKAADGFLPAGFGFKAPFITQIKTASIQQRTATLRAECFSSDLQQVTVELRVLYRVPEAAVVQIFKDFAGSPFDTLIAPRVQEALKEVTATQSAEQIVKTRETIKLKALQTAQEKIGNLLKIEDLVIFNINLSAELESAIEAKMVAEQEAAKARFMQQQVQVEANTAIIKAKGEAEAIRIRGEALKLNPAYLRLQIVERWNGRSPSVVPGGSEGNGAGLLLPIGDPAAPVAP